MDKLDKSTKFKMKFNSIMENLSDPTLLDAEIIIHDFNVSENGQCITKEVCEENMSSLIGKRITCQYIKAEDNNGLDAFGSHGEYIGLDRNGNEQVYTDSIAVGFVKDVYIGEDNGIECLMGKCTLWRDDKYRDISNLLLDWNSRGVRISMSCEYLYINYEVKEGIEYIKTPIIYTAHTLLNSEDRGDIGVVEPAYNIATMSFNDIKSWNTALNSLNNKLNNKEADKMENAIFEMLKSSNAISAGDLEWKLWDAFGSVLTHNQYETMWLSKYNIFTEEHYVIVEAYIDDKWSTYKVEYTVDENDVVALNWEGRIQVEYQFTYEMVEVKNSLNAKEEKVIELEKSLNEMTTELEETKISLNSKAEEVTTLSTDKDGLTSKINEVNETLISLNETVTSKDEEIASLNAKIEEMKPIVDTYEAEQFEKSLNELKDVYADKFAKVGATEVYELESTQELIKQCVNAVDNSAKFALNQLIVDNVVSTIKVEDNTEMVKSVNSIIKSKGQNNLVPDMTDVYEDISGISR